MVEKRKAEAWPMRAWPSSSFSGCLTLLSVLALEFCFSMRTELNITRNYKEKEQLYYYAQGGIHRGIAELIYRSDPVLHQKRTAPKGLRTSRERFGEGVEV